MGYLKSIPDPQDGRATLVILEARGQQYFHDMQDVKHTLDTTLAEMLGEERVTQLVTTLQDLIKQTQPAAPPSEE